MLKCHRSGDPPANSKRASKKCGCAFKVAISCVYDDEGYLVNFLYREIGPHTGHVPSDEEDRRWLKDLDGSKQDAASDEGSESDDSGDEGADGDGAAGGDGAVAVEHGPGAS